MRNYQCTLNLTHWFF